MLVLVHPLGTAFFQWFWALFAASGSDSSHCQMKTSANSHAGPPLTSGPLSETRGVSAKISISLGFQQQLLSSSKVMETAKSHSTIIFPGQDNIPLTAEQRQRAFTDKTLFWKRLCKNKSEAKSRVKQPSGVWLPGSTWGNQISSYLPLGCSQLCR